MQESKVVNLELTKRYLEVIHMQNNAFLSQMGSFIETLNDNKSQIKNFDIIRKNICQTFKFSSQINEMIVECKNDVSSNLNSAMQTLKVERKVIQPVQSDTVLQNHQMQIETNDKYQDFSENQIYQEKRVREDQLISDYKLPTHSVRKSAVDDLQDRISNCMINRPKPASPSQNLRRELNLGISQLSRNEIKPVFSGEFSNNMSFIPPLSHLPDFKPDLSEIPKFSLDKDPLSFQADFKPQESFSKAFELFFGKREPTYDPFEPKSISRFSVTKNSMGFFETERHRDPMALRMLHRSHISKRERGAYKICSMDIKTEALEMARSTGVKYASDLLNIPEKNIKRWLKQGPERKKGAGRKTMDPDMETGLLGWIAEMFRRNKVFPDFKEIKSQAKLFSSNGSFKASKGWCDKFMKRNYVFFENLRIEMQKSGKRKTEESRENAFNY